MFNPSFSNLFIEARVADLHRAAGNGTRSRRRTRTATRAAFASVVTRTSTGSRQS